MATENLKPSPPSAKELPAADVTAPAGSAGAIVNQSFPVRQPEQDLDEFLIQVRASTLKRCRRHLERIRRGKLPWHEILLAFSSLSYGAVLGAVPANIPLGTPKWYFFFVALPVVGTGTAVAYFFKRKEAGPDASTVAGEVLEDLPDPGKTR